MPSVDIQWNDDNTITVAPPKRPKKLTATKFAAVLGLNRWTTPFQVWCEVTRTYNEPFEDTIYTIAGKAIEPKQIQYMRDAYAMDDLRDPTDLYGPDYFKKTWGNFFSHPILGGMWDAIEIDEQGNATRVLEFKTTKRAEDWAEDVPEYYALQAALYAWLLDCDDVVMVASFLADNDYDDPEAYVPCADNTATFEFLVSERYPDFVNTHIRPALQWWADHVETGVSPEYDEKLDADYLKALRNASLNPTSDIDAMLDELADLNAKVAAIKASAAKDEDRIEEIKAQLKKYAAENIGDKDTATIGNSRVTCKLARTYSVKLDEARMVEDGIYGKYATEKESTRFTVSFSK